MGAKQNHRNGFVMGKLPLSTRRKKKAKKNISGLKSKQKG